MRSVRDYFSMKFMNEGLAAEKGVRPTDVDYQQLVKGIRVEMEHTDSDQIAMKIALDHLAEFPFYYDYLEEMEKWMAEDMKKLEPIMRFRKRR